MNFCNAGSFIHTNVLLCEALFLYMPYSAYNYMKLANPICVYICISFACGSSPSVMLGRCGVRASPAMCLDGMAPCNCLLYAPCSPFSCHFHGGKPPWYHASACYAHPAAHSHAILAVASHHGTMHVLAMRTLQPIVMLVQPRPTFSDKLGPCA